MRSSCFSSTLFLILLPLACAYAANTWYVDVNSPQDGPGDAPETAWRIIQDAIDHIDVQAGDTILVAPGVYDQGGHYYVGGWEASYNRVFINKAVTVKAVSTNPVDTVIVGQPDPFTGASGTNAYRGARISGGGVIAGFTITNGFAGIGLRGQLGGGVYLTGAASIVSNCVLTGNGGTGVIAVRDPGGAVYNSKIVNNPAAAMYSYSFNDNLRIFNSTIENNSAGLRNVTAVNCILRGNGAIAAQSCMLVNCLVAEHTGKYVWGTVWGGTAINCTITLNDTLTSAAYGNVTGTDLYNCILWGNIWSGNYNYSNISDPEETMNTCIGVNFNGTTYSGPTNLFYEASLGIDGNIVQDPLFLDPASDFRLDRRQSPCINSGDNFYILSVISNYPSAAFDLDGNPRISQGVVDMGAYEYKPPPPGSLYRFF